MSQNYTWPSQVVVTSSQSEGLNGSLSPIYSTQVGGKNPSGDLEPLNLDSSNYLNVNVQATVVPAGGATAANQALEITQLDGINNNTSHLPASLGQTTMSASLPVAIASDQSAIPITQSSGPWTINLTEVSGSAIALGQTTKSASLPVTLASDEGNIPVTVATSLPAGSNTIGAVTQASGPWTQNLTQVSGSSLGLGQTTMSASLPVTLASNQSALAVTQSSGPWNQNITEIGGSTLALGQTTMSASIPVTLASNQTSLPISVSGKSQANSPVYNVYSSTNVTTSAYVQMIASTSSTTNYLDIFDSSGQAMILATGGSGSEVILAYIPPGGDQIPVNIPSGTRISYKALTANATTGYLLINLWS